MKDMKAGVFASLVVALLLGAGLFVSSQSNRAKAEPVVVKDQWRHHDGHWSYWHEGDKRWYYTDGSNWFYEDGGNWNVYRFDKQFGREGFERGEYKIPGEDVKIVIPRHRVFRR